ncbi:MAG: DUF5106 domain-containing protein [Bacteroidia bacterium]|nr:DUF5106 domain-containing protein [Bacteroidia bacterium]
MLTSFYKFASSFKNNMIKKIFFLSTILILSNTVFSQGYKITIKIKGLKANSTCLLANYYADKNQLKDSAKTDKNGVMVFKGKNILPNGIYLLVTPDHNYFEFVISNKEQEFTLETDTLFDIDNFVIKNSEENRVFFDFNKFASQKSVDFEVLKEKMKFAKTKKDTLKIQAQYRVIDSLIQDKRKTLSETNPTLFISKIYRSFIDVPTPEPLRKPDGSLVDSNYKYNFYKNHYWDNIDLGEDGLLRSPVFHNKLKYFFSSVFVQVPDTIIKETDKLLKKIETAGAKDLFRYSVSWITNHFEDSKIVCMDKVLHYMGTNYYCAGKTPWADTAMVRKMCEHIVKIRPTLCDEIAPPITNLFDSTYNKQIDLYSINSPFIVLIFWDHQCGHCQKSMPRLNVLYDSLNKAGLKFEVYSVYTQDDWAGWKKYLKDHKLKYINVANMYGTSTYRRNYFFISTPQIFILDKDKRIKLKGIDVENLPNILELLYKDEKLNSHKKK